MSFGSGWSSMGDNEARKAQLLAQQRQQEMQRQAAEAQQYQRMQEEFQRRMIAQEQGRRNQESQAAIRQRDFEMREKYRRPTALERMRASLERRMDQSHELKMQDLRNQPAMKAADAIAGMGDAPSAQAGLFDRDGQRIGGGFSMGSERTPIPGMRPSGESALRQGLLRK